MAKPIDIVFVMGPARSGTTMLLDFLTVHREQGWIPEKLAQDPAALELAGMVRRQHWPLLGDFWLERRYAWKRVASPAEDHAFWSHWLPGFDPAEGVDGVPGPEDLTEEAVQQVREAVAEVAWRQGVKRMTGHYTGFPRVRLLRKVFPEARFILLARDPRSVAYHQFRIRGEEHPIWEDRARWRERMPAELQARAAELADTPVNAYGLWVRWMRQLAAEEFAGIPANSWMEVGLADLVSKPAAKLKEVLSFVGLPFDKRFDYYVKHHAVQHANQRTNRKLEETEEQGLEKAVAPLADEV